MFFLTHLCLSNLYNDLSPWAVCPWTQVIVGSFCDYLFQNLKVAPSRPVIPCAGMSNNI